VGLVLATVWGVRAEPPVVLASVLLLAVFRKRTLTMLVAAMAVGLLVGVWRGGAVQQRLAVYHTFYDRQVVLRGQVVDDPVYDDHGRLDFRVGAVLLNGRPMVGQVRIKALVNGVRRGDAIRVGGKLSDGFGPYQASLYYPKVESVVPSRNPLESLRRQFFASVYSVLPEPQASLGLGFLVGLRSQLPEDLDEQLQVVGLTHIVVASGYNLTVLVRLSRRVLAKYSKYQALVGSLALIAGFLTVTGASPSMVRASVVTVLSLLAWYYGRKFRPTLILLLGAALTAGYNPLYIWGDLGWWLSFLAFAGVLILAPLITVRLYGKKSPSMLVQVGIETLAAQALATPLIIFAFGKLSMIALIANMAVVPLIPFAMVGTFVAGVAGLVLPSGLAAWFAVPADVLLGYVVSATRFFASPAWAQRNVQIGASVLVGMYVVLLGMLAVLHLKTKQSFQEIPAVVE
jgi:competence protein ComEC